jgi:hypothetical protein
MERFEAILNEGDEVVAPEGKCLKLIDFAFGVKGFHVLYELVDPDTYGCYNSIGR